MAKTRSKLTAVLIPASLRLSNYCAVAMSRTAASLHIRSTLMGLKRRPLLWALFVALLVVCELGMVSLLYRHAFPFNCRAVAPEIFCGFMSEMVLRAISVLAALLIFIFARPRTLGPLIDGARSRSRSFGWLAVQVAGAGLIMAPWFFLKNATDPPLVALGAGLWIAGGGFAVAGTMFSIAAPAAWGEAVRRAGIALPGVVAAAVFTPEMADLFSRLWQWDLISAATFRTVIAFLQALGMEVVSTPAEMIIGADGFIVAVGRQCSGVEGFLLIGLFLLIYFALFRKELRFPMVWLLLPIGILLSWALNTVRIGVLIWIGAHVSPDLAINGFHSHAGWLLFSVLSLSLIGFSRLVPWFQNGDAATVEAPASVTPLLRDRNAAEILPFVVFMASALVASTFSEVPAVHYPLRAVAMLAALLLFRSLYLRLEWRFDPLAAVAGVAIGIVWVLTQEGDVEKQSALGEALAAMPPAIFALWVFSRIFGTTLLVPLIEELFFRGYLLRRLDSGGIAMRVVAIATSAGLFAVLHDRWLLAAAAGVVLSLLVLRQGRLTDAILAHVVANGIVAFWAVATGDWTII